MKPDHAEWVADLSERYGRMVISTAYAILGNTADAEDVLQEVFLKMLKVKNIQPLTMAKNEMGPYLRVVASNCALDHYRRRARRKQDSLESIQDNMQTPIDQNPQNTASQNQNARLLRQALSMLPKRDAQIFALRYFDDLSYEEIAKQLDSTVSQVGVVLHRVRQRLQEMLQPILEPKECMATQPVVITGIDKEISHAKA